MQRNNYSVRVEPQYGRPEQIWMDTLGFIFEKKPSIRDNRSKYNEKLCQPVPGHPELTSNKMAQIWNNLKLNNAKSITDVRASALEWYRQNLQN